jgi:hypothetical protein
MSRPPLALPGLAAHVASVTLSLLVLAALAAGPAAAGPTIGFVENFGAAPSVAGWNSQASNTNPGTGGIGGASDGYLRIARTTFAAQLGSKNSNPDYIGDYLSAGANRIKFSLNDVGANQNLEIHFAIGNTNTFWVSTVGFIPPENAWAEFTVNLSDTASFVNVIDFTGDSYSKTLTLVDRVQVRHDTAPYVMSADAILGEFGLDGFKIEASAVDVDPARPEAGRPVMLAAPFPNPSRGPAMFSWESFDGSPVTIAVVDARGRVLRRETLPSEAPGRHAWTWDGRDGEGRLVAAGVYRVRAFGAAGGTSRPLVRLD